MSEQVPVGTLVVHSRFGLGKVLLTDDGYVTVYFKDIEGEPKDAVKRLSISVAQLTLAPLQTDQVLDNLPPMVHGGKVVPPNRFRVTEQQAINLFIRDYRSFEDPKYLRQERSYKWEAHQKAVAELIAGPGRQMAAESQGAELGKVLASLVHATNLPSTQEKIRFTQALRDPDAALAYGRGLLGFVDAPSAQSFGDMVDALGSLAADKSQRMTSWPNVTILPFLADPTRQMFLKPKVTQRVAEGFMFDLLYDAQPSWAIYERLLRLSEILLNRLRPLGAKDFIDVQSFMWIVEGIANMKKG